MQATRVFRLGAGLVLSFVGVSAHAGYLTGSAAITDVGSGTSLSNGSLSLEPTLAADLVQTNPGAGSTFAGITSNLGFASFPIVGFNSALNLNGVVTVTGPADTQTAESITNLFDVGSYQFNLTSLGVANSGTTLYGTGVWVDTSNGLSATGGLFTLSTTSNWTSFNGTYSATGVAPVPLPASAWLMLSGVVGLGAMLRRRRAA